MTNEERQGCRHGWRGEPAERISVRCPACMGGIFVGKGGYLTCSSLSCPNPGAPTDALNEYGGMKDELERLRSDSRQLTAVLDWLRKYSPEMFDRLHRDALAALAHGTEVKT